MSFISVLPTPLNWEATYPNPSGDVLSSADCNTLMLDALRMGATHKQAVSAVDIAVKYRMGHVSTGLWFTRIVQHFIQAD